MSDAPVAIIGAGPTGLIAAEILSAAGKKVVVYERMPSVARKFLMAGRGGLNLTHAEPLETFVTRYGAASPRLRPMLEAFTPKDLIAWAEGLGLETFTGSSGRVFPRTMKASPLLRAWLSRLAERGVELRPRRRWTGWTQAGALTFMNDSGEVETQAAAATLLALGGASWPKLGADGVWTDILAQRGVAIAPLMAANAGFDVNWSPHLCDRFAGAPLKTIAIGFGKHNVRGEAIVTRYGIEGGAIYALGRHLREALARGAPIVLHIDLRPALSEAQIAAKLAQARRGDTLSSTLRKQLGLTPVAINLLREHGPPSNDPQTLAALIKAAPVTLTGSRGLERAISTAGGVAWSAVDDQLELKSLPGVYAAGEMLDWDAPTGGYLLQASFATGVWAARAMLLRGADPTAPPRAGA